MAYRNTYPIADGVAVSPYGSSVTPYPIITSDGNYPSTEGVEVPSGMLSVEVVGAFGGGTATLQLRSVGGFAWVPIGTNTVFTSNGVAGFYAPAGRLRLNVTGSTGASLRAAIRRIGD